MSSRSRTPLVIAAVLAVVVVVAIAAVVLAGVGDDEDTASTVAPVPSSAPGEPAVKVDGAPLAPLPREGTDPAIGAVAPALSGFDYTGNSVDITPGSDGPMVLVFLAHWCPHCNREIPVLQEWQASGEIPDDLQVVGISTGVRSDAPNYPPGEWLVEKGWEWPVLADDAEAAAAEAYGVTAYPFLVLLDADGNVTARTSGELPVEALQALADETVASAS